MRIVPILLPQWQHDEVSRFPRRQAAGLIGPAERLRPAEGCHAEQGFPRHIGMPLVNKARFRPEVEVRIGREAIGAEGDTNAAGQEFAERMRRMAEGGVGAGAVDD